MSHNRVFLLSNRWYTLISEKGTKRNEESPHFNAFATMIVGKVTCRHAILQAKRHEPVELRIMLIKAVHLHSAGYFPRNTLYLCYSYLDLSTKSDWITVIAEHGFRRKVL